VISKVEILGSRLERAETVYNFSASGVLIALWLTVLGIWSQPDPRIEHCYAALDTFENMRLGVMQTPGYKLPVKVGVK
jgi:hypothetical protein